MIRPSLESIVTALRRDICNIANRSIQVASNVCNQVARYVADASCNTSHGR